MAIDARTGSSPVFLLGFPRSGTTLLRLYLDAHSQLAIPFESFVLIEFSRRMPEYGELGTRAERARLVGDLLAAKGIRSWNPAVMAGDIDLDRCATYAATIDQLFTAYAKRCGKSLWGDKTPSYTGDLHVLNELFPSARFVHLIRDGRDAAFSLARQPWGTPDPWEALRQWNEIVGWSRKMGRMLPAGRYLEVRYEDLITAAPTTVGRITAFLRLPFEPSMLDAQRDIAAKIPSRSAPFHRSLERPPDSTLVFAWRQRLSATDQVLALQVAGGLLAELGYPAHAEPVGYFRILARKVWNWAVATLRWRRRRRMKRRTRKGSP